MLQKYDHERDDAQRKWDAAIWGAEIKDNASNGRPQKQTMTAQDIMQNFKTSNG